MAPHRRDVRLVAIPRHPHDLPSLLVICNSTRALGLTLNWAGPVSAHTLTSTHNHKSTTTTPINTSQPPLQPPPTCHRLVPPSVLRHDLCPRLLQLLLARQPRHRGPGTQELLKLRRQRLQEMDGRTAAQPGKWEGTQRSRAEWKGVECVVGGAVGLRLAMAVRARVWGQGEGRAERRQSADSAKACIPPAHRAPVAKPTPPTATSAHPCPAPTATGSYIVVPPRVPLEC